MNWFERAKEHLAKWKSEQAASEILFSPRAQQVLVLARKEAVRLNHNFIGTGHILLGLVCLGGGVAGNVLAKLGLNAETVRSALEKILPTGEFENPPGAPYTPSVKKVFVLAQKNAKNLYHTYVGTEHLLLALLEEGDGPAAKVFKQFNLSCDKLRLEILRELDPNISSLDNSPGDKK
jgi:ATP-dependent Clp protease ATP-binding subunit ClpC